jgi:hypothetical protein
MIAVRLVRMIENHSDQLAHGLMKKLSHSKRVAELRKIPAPELEQRVYEIYHNLSDWLLSKTESDIERRYTVIGARRAGQGVTLSCVLYAIVATKEYLWDFLSHEGQVDRPVELFQEIELLRLVDKFFDRAMYYAACGYERASLARVA